MCMLLDKTLHIYKKFQLYSEENMQCRCSVSWYFLFVSLKTSNCCCLYVINIKASFESLFIISNKMPFENCLWKFTSHLFKTLVAFATKRYLAYWQLGKQINEIMTLKRTTIWILEFNNLISEFSLYFVFILCDGCSLLYYQLNHFFLG